MVRVSRATAERLRGLLAGGPPAGPGAPTRAGGDDRQNIHVLVTGKAYESDSDSGSGDSGEPAAIPGLFVCRPTAYAPVDGAWTDYVSSLAMPPNPGQKLVVGNTYMAVCYGQDAEGNWFYATENGEPDDEDDSTSGSGGGSGSGGDGSDGPGYSVSITALTSIACVDGEIVDTSTTWTITSDSPISIGES